MCVLLCPAVTTCYPIQGHLSTSFNDTYYQLAAMPGRNPGVPSLTEAQVQALEAFREVAEEVKLDFWLKPGDLQLVHNHTQVHNRSAYEDYEVRGEEIKDRRGVEETPPTCGMSCRGMRAYSMMSFTWGVFCHVARTAVQAPLGRASGAVSAQQHGVLPLMER